MQMETFPSDFSDVSLEKMSSAISVVSEEISD